MGNDKRVRELDAATSILGSHYVPVDAGSGALKRATISEVVAASNAQSRIYNVLDYGAKGDGATDDTAAIQACINAAISAGSSATVTRNGLGEVYVPAGRYLISAPLRVESVIDFRMRGAGYGTVLSAVGTLTCILDLNGVAYCQFSDFAMSGETGAEVTRALWLRWNGTNRSTSTNTLRNLMVRGLLFTRAGFEFGDASNPSVQVDNTSVHDCLVGGGWTTGETTNWQSGFHVGTGTYGNNLLHHFYGCQSNLTRYNLYIDASQAIWTGGALGNAEVDIYAKVTTYLKVSGFRSESSERMLKTAPASLQGEISIENCEWYTDAMNEDDNFIVHELGGCLRLINLTVSSLTEDTPKIAAGYHNTFTTLIIEGGSSIRSLADLVTPHQNLAVVAFGYNQIAFQGLPQSSTNFMSAGSNGGLPVLTVQQSDVSEEFLRFIGTSGTDASQSLVDAVDMEDPGTIAGWLKIYVRDDKASDGITDGAYFIPFYSAPTHSA